MRFDRYAHGWSSSAPSGLQEATAPGAEALAVRVVGFLARDHATFLSRMGLSGKDLVQPPLDPECLAAALEYVVGNEAVLRDFTRTVGLPLESVYAARRHFRNRGGARGGSNGRGNRA